jgi:pyridoxamine 5'-phosphate oxidase
VTAPPHPDLAGWRREYGAAGLSRDDLGLDPIAKVGEWLAAAEMAGLHEPNAMVLSTVGPNGPSSRIVLLKGLDERGFVFYTNYESRKATELAADPACSLVFPWHPLQRQVRVEGVASRLDAAESDAYFASRPREAQIGAWASPQSQVIESREILDSRYDQEAERLTALDFVPRPEHWGGIVVRPRCIEFWQGRPGRLHDRLRFQRTDETGWRVDRLAP